MDWLKLDSKGILRGSLSTTDNTTQLIWVKLLAIANETRDRNGILQYANGKPYSMDYIATLCNVSRQELDLAIEQFKQDIRDGNSRVTFTDDGSMVLTNWLHYQKKPEPKPKENRKSEEARLQILRFYANKYPDVALDVVLSDFGYNIVNKTTGEICETVKDALNSFSNNGAKNE